MVIGTPVGLWAFVRLSPKYPTYVTKTALDIVDLHYWRHILRFS